MILTSFLDIVGTDKLQEDKITVNIKDDEKKLQVCLLYEKIMIEIFSPKQYSEAECPSEENQTGNK